MVLLHLLRWLRERSHFEFSVLLKEGGSLRAEFEAVAETRFYAEIPRRVERPPLQRVLRKEDC